MFISKTRKGISKQGVIAHAEDSGNAGKSEVREPGLTDLVEILQHVGVMDILSRMCTLYIRAFVLSCLSDGVGGKGFYLFIIFLAILPIYIWSIRFILHEEWEDLSEFGAEFLKWPLLSYQINHFLTIRNAQTRG